MATSNLDASQSKLSANFPQSHYLSDQEHVNRIIDWTTFYRRNLNRFASHYLGLRLFLYQEIILYLMGVYSSFCIVASRAAAKSFIIAIYACCRAILYPGSVIVIASATKNQSKLIVSEQIRSKLLVFSPNLRREIESIKENQNDVIVNFHNGSFIKVVPANENARGSRSDCIIHEEFRMIDKTIVDSVISPLSYIRPRQFATIPEYADVYEESIKIYISSAWMKSHWMWGIIKSTAKGMYDGTSCLIALDYSITLMHKIKSRRDLIDQKKKLDPISWAIEYENEMLSTNTKAYFTLDMLTRNQTLKKAFYPTRNDEYTSRTKNKNTIPKQDGEIRILSCDVAMISSPANDNSCFSFIRVFPEIDNTDDDNRSSRNSSYRVQIPYLEAFPGRETSLQAMRIKQLFDDFDCDYIVLDVRNAGISVGDALMRYSYDEERDVERKPWTYINSDELSKRVVNPNALPVIYAFNGTAKLNSEIAVNLRNLFTENMIDLLINNTESTEEILRRFPDYLTTTDTERQLYYERPYLETMLLVNEMANLEYEKLENTGAIRVRELSGETKDRYVSLAMGCYFASELARDMYSNDSDVDFSNIKPCVTDINFD